MHNKKNYGYAHIHLLSEQIQSHFSDVMCLPIAHELEHHIVLNKTEGLSI